LRAQALGSERRGAGGRYGTHHVLGLLHGALQRGDESRELGDVGGRAGGAPLLRGHGRREDVAHAVRERAQQRLRLGRLDAELAEERRQRRGRRRGERVES
jgi:hypothetical protein